MSTTRAATLVPLLSGLSMAYSQVVTAIFGAFLASYLGAEDYGTINLARNIFVIAIVLSPFGLDLALQRHLAHTPEGNRGNEVAWLRLITFGVAAAIAALLFTELAQVLETHVFRHAGFGLVLAVTMAALPFATDMAVLGGAYRGIYRPLLTVVTTYFVQPTLRLVAILSLFAFMSGLWAVLIGTLISFVLSWGLLAVRAQQLFPVRRDGLRRGGREAAKVLRYAPVLGFSTFVFTMARGLDTISLGYWGQLADVGRYGIVLMVAQLVGTIGIALGQTLGTSVAAAARDGDRDRIGTLLTNNMSMASILCAPLCIAIVVWGSDIDLLLGPSYVIAAPVFAFAAMSQWLISVTHYSSTALSLTGRHMLEFANNIGALLVQAVLCAILVPRYGILGAAISTTLMILALTLVRQIQIRVTLGLRLLRFRLLAPLAISALIALPLAYLQSRFALRAWWLTGGFAGMHVLISFLAIFAVTASAQQREQILRLLKVRK